MFRNDKFLWWGVVSTLSNPQAGGPPIICCMQLLIQYIPSYPPHWRMFLHLQPEDVLCCGDTDPFIMEDHIIVGNIVQLQYYLKLFSIDTTQYSQETRHLCHQQVLNPQFQQSCSAQSDVP